MSGGETSLAGPGGAAGRRLGWHSLVPPPLACILCPRTRTHTPHAVPPADCTCRSTGYRCDVPRVGSVLRALVPGGTPDAVIEAQVQGIKARMECYPFARYVPRPSLGPGIAGSPAHTP